MAYAHTNVTKDRNQRHKSRPRGAKWPNGFASGQGPFGGTSRTARRSGTKARLRTWQH